MLEDAAFDIRFLLDKGYDRKSTIRFVGDHYMLDETMRYLLARVVHSGRIAQERIGKTVACRQIRGKTVFIDGYNLLITVESILEGKPVFLCDDGFIRDIRGIFRNYRKSDVTDRALDLILRILKENGADSVYFILDSQISKSGELARQIRERLAGAGIRGDALTSKHVDHDIKTRSSSGTVVATSDGAIIDEVETVVDIPGCILERLGMSVNRLKIMKIGIIITDPDDWTAKAYERSVKASGAKPYLFNLGDVTSNVFSGSIFTNSLDLKALDAVIVRDVGSGSLPDISFRFDLLCQMEDFGITVINSSGAIQNAANKYISSSCFQKNRIATPRTVVTHDLDVAIDSISEFGCAVVKPIFGYKGIGVEKISDGQQDHMKLERLLKERGILYIQEFIENPGRDIRAFVVGGRVINSIYRVASPGSWINNLSQGGKAVPCSLTREQEEMSIRAAQSIGADYAGVDLIEGDRTYVLEVNGTPSGKGLHDALGVDVTVYVVEHLRGKVRDKLNIYKNNI